MYYRVEKSLESCEGIDFLINNAGSSLSLGLEQLSEDQWHHDLDLKLMGALRMFRGVIPLMKKRGGANVNATTGAGKVHESIAASNEFFKGGKD